MSHSIHRILADLTKRHRDQDADVLSRRATFLRVKDWVYIPVSVCTLLPYLCLASEARGSVSTILAQFPSRLGHNI